MNAVAHMCMNTHTRIHTHTHTKAHTRMHIRTSTHARITCRQHASWTPRRMGAWWCVRRPWRAVCWPCGGRDTHTQKQPQAQGNISSMPHGTAQIPLAVSKVFLPLALPLPCPPLQVTTEEKGLSARVRRTRCASIQVCGPHSCTAALAAHEQPRLIAQQVSRDASEDGRMVMLAACSDWAH